MGGLGGDAAGAIQASRSLEAEGLNAAVTPCASTGRTCVTGICGSISTAARTVDGVGAQEGCAAGN